MNNKEFRQYFDVRDIDIKDANMFFQMLCAAADARGGEVDMATFIGGCLRLKGIASAIDVQTLSFECKLMYCMQREFFASVEERFEELHETLQGLQQSLQAEQQTAKTENCFVPTS